MKSQFSREDGHSSVEAKVMKDLLSDSLKKGAKKKMQSGRNDFIASALKWN